MAWTVRILEAARSCARSWRARSLALMFIAPLLATVITYSLFYLARDLNFIGNISDQAMGTRMTILADTSKPRPGARPIVFMDFDDETFARLGDPVLVPPRDVARIIERLAPSKPWAVVVDIDVASVTDSADADALRRGITKLDTSGAALLLGRETLPSRTGGPRRRLRPSVLDQDIARSDRAIWASVAYDIAGDGVVRRFSPVQSLEGGGYLPSIPLAAKILQMEGSAAGLKRVVASARGAGGTGRANIQINFRTRSGRLTTGTRDAFPVRYSFSWPPAAAYALITTSAGSSRQIIRVPAHTMLAWSGDQQAAMFRDALVIVGATAVDRDLKPTPLGMMPGAYVIANASRGWLEFGLERSSYWQGLVFTLLGAACLSALSLAVLHWTPAHWKDHAENHLASGMTAILWLLFLAVGNPMTSVGLIVTAFTVMKAVEICHNRSGVTKRGGHARKQGEET